MLEEFLGDTVYAQEHPTKMNFEILCTSMGNHVILNYVRLRKKKKIPMVKVYERLLFMGSSAQRNSFKPGKSFDNLDQMTDTVDVFVNYFDTPLSMASLFHGHNVMGNYGPKDVENLPGYINVHEIYRVLSAQDIPGMGHDYFFRNPVVKEQMIESGYSDLERNID